MSDLHERLTAAVNARLEVARAALPGFMPIIRSAAAMSGFNVLNVLPFAEINDPATVIRHCERDLRVLTRHAPRQMTFGPEPRPSQCEACADMCHSGSGLGCDDLDAPYPCDEIRDMATAYAVEVLE